MENVEKVKIDNSKLRLGDLVYVVHGASILDDNIQIAEAVLIKFTKTRVIAQILNSDLQIRFPYTKTKIMKTEADEFGLRYRLFKDMLQFLNLQKQIKAEKEAEAKRKNYLDLDILEEIDKTING